MHVILRTASLGISWGGRGAQVLADGVYPHQALRKAHWWQQEPAPGGRGAEKKRAAEIFRARWIEVDEDPAYQRLKERHIEHYERRH